MPSPKSTGRSDERHVNLIRDVEIIEYNLEADEIEDEETKYSKKKFADLSAITHHRPWDELELKDHGLVDKKGHHFETPRGSVDPQKLQEVKATAEATKDPANTMGTLHLPFDEVAMKYSGYMDKNCRRMTEEELNQDFTHAPDDDRHVKILDQSLRSEFSGSIPTTRKKRKKAKVFDDVPDQIPVGSWPQKSKTGKEISSGTPSPLHNDNKRAVKSTSCSIKRELDLASVPLKSHETSKQESPAASFNFADFLKPGTSFRAFIKGTIKITKKDS